MSGLMDDGFLYDNKCKSSDFSESLILLLVIIWNFMNGSLGWWGPPRKQL